MSIATPPTRIGLGDTERFIMSDPSPFLEDRALREHPVRAMIGTIFAPAPDKAESREEKLSKMGLVALIRAERKAIPLEAAAMFYPEMVGDELKLWQKFLPSEYSLRDYEYDSITDEALEQITIAQQLGYFDSIVIWTPEGNTFTGRTKRQAAKTRLAIEDAADVVAERLAIAVETIGDYVDDALGHLPASRSFNLVDPLAVGIISDSKGVQHLFPIVRWGESELMSKDEIVAYVKKVDGQVLKAILAGIGAIVVPITMIAGAVSKRKR